MIGDKKVVLPSDKPLGKDEIALPKGTTLFDETEPRVILTGELLKGMPKTKPQALSQMKVPESNEELLEKKK